MFGLNPIVSQHLDDAGALKVVDMFYTLQGEGPYSGMTSVFVRLADCNLRCVMCFVPSTMIKMGDFTSKRIDQIAVGDLVLSWSGSEFVKKRVTKTMRSFADTVIRVDAGGIPVFCTPEHPFLVSGKGWVEASNLQPGDKLVHFSGSDAARMNNSRTRAKANGTLTPVSQRNRDNFGKRISEKWNNPDWRSMQVRRMVADNPMKKAGVAGKAFKTMTERNKFKMTGLERAFLKVCGDLPVAYVGDGKLIIGDKCPDFIVPGSRKLIEIWAADAEWSKGRGEQYIAERAEYFAKSGYETLFLPLTYANFRQCDGGRKALHERVGQYISNGKVVKSVTVVNDKGLARIYGAKDAPKEVFNFEVEDTHTYVANGMVVHNCDTDFTTGARVVDVETLVQQVRTLAGNKTRLVVITGGEPLLQNIVPFCRLLAKYNFRVQIETAGTVWVPGLEGCDIALVCSPKTGKVRVELQDRCINFKYVVGAGDEVSTTGAIVASYQLGSKPMTLAQPARKDATIWIQPRDDQDPEKNAANTAFARDLCLKYGYRMCVQLHKLVQVP